MRRYLTVVLAVLLLSAPTVQAAANHDGQCYASGPIEGFVLVLPGGFYLEFREVASEHEVVGVLVYAESNGESGFQYGGGGGIVPENPLVSDADPCFEDGDALVAVFLHRADT